MEHQRALLDQFFGTDRDLPLPKHRKKKTRFFDKDVCKYHIMGVCPYHDLFKNTKSDLGPCHYRLHDDKFREDYNTLSADDKQKYGYERELFRKLNDLVRDMDRKILRNKKRADEENIAKVLSKEQQLMLDSMTTRIHALMEFAQKHGEQGNIDQSIRAAQEGEKIRIEKQNLEQRLKFPGGRIMFVCDVCGVFINNTDNEARRADHYNGKQYLGWKAIRDKLKELEKKFSRPLSTQKIKSKDHCMSRNRSNIN